MTLTDKIKFFAQLKYYTRAYFHSKNYDEIDTKIRLVASIPEAYIDPIEAEGFTLRTSPEGELKKVIALTDIEKVFQIAPCFRKNEYSHKHNSEFTLLEFYHSGDMYSILKETKKYFCFLSKKLKKKEEYFQSNWQILSVSQAFEKYCSIPLSQALENNTFEETLNKEVEPKLGKLQPTILINYPQEYAALAKKNNDGTCQRWELYFNTMEIANAYSELLFTSKNKEAFNYEKKLRQKINKKIYPEDKNFLNAIENIKKDYGGIAIGLERLTMFLLDLEDIQELFIQYN